MEGYDAIPLCRRGCSSVPAIRSIRSVFGEGKRETIARILVFPYETGKRDVPPSEGFRSMHSAFPIGEEQKLAVGYLVRQSLASQSERASEYVQESRHEDHFAAKNQWIFCR